MVAEVEFRNIAEMVKVGDLYVPYTTNPKHRMFSGFLTNDGKTLTVDVNREIPVYYTRQLYLYYGNVDYSYSRIDYVSLGSTPLLTNDPSISEVGSSHKFDLSSVYSIPTRSASNVPINDVTIDLYTSEANVTDSNGDVIYQRRLTVPYTVVGDVTATTPQSTDGWYVLGLVDYKIENISKPSKQIFFKGDIIYWYDSFAESNDPDSPPIAEGDLWIATKDTYEVPAAGISDWSIPTDEDILNFVLAPRPDNYTECATIVHSDILISRYVKQQYIGETLKRISFKKWDDKTAYYEIDRLTSMRELALHYLEIGDSVKAKYMLDMIENEFYEVMNNGNDRELKTRQQRYTL